MMENTAKSAAFLAEKAREEGIVKTDSGTPLPGNSVRATATAPRSTRRPRSTTAAP